MAADSSDFVLEMEDITKRFPGVLALDRMNLKVRPGTVHVLVGENGAGKSTLMKILSGVYAIDGGRIRFEGEVLDTQDTASAPGRGISMIHHELSPVLDMTIAENVFLGREPMRSGVLSRFVDFDRLYADTAALLKRLRLEYDPRTKMRDLSIASMQLVEITKAISRDSSLVIMNEFFAVARFIGYDGPVTLEMEDMGMEPLTGVTKSLTTLKLALPRNL